MKSRVSVGVLVAAVLTLAGCGDDPADKVDCGCPETGTGCAEAGADALPEAGQDVSAESSTPEANPCHECTTNADCTGGLVCFDEDNNPGTPKVCTKPYDPSTGCPDGMHGDYNVSKYCICDDCGGVFNPKCDPTACLYVGAAGSTVGECKLTGDKCDCQPSANYCKKCEKDADCTGGLVCFDEDNNPGTPKVCTKPYDPATGCPPGMHGDYSISKYCICEDCGNVLNPRCEPIVCLAQTAAGSVVGKCQANGDKCDCAPSDNVCQKCEKDTDCTGGLVCFDEDNNPGTPKVCTKLYDPATGCPPGMHGDYNVSKYCICEDCGNVLNPRCEPLVCLATTAAGSVVGECRANGDKCDCEPAANTCQKCEKDAECTGGLVCFDDDNNAGTPKVCTKPYDPAVGCPPGMYGDFSISKFCICEDCGSVLNPKCEQSVCLAVTAAGGKVGVCKLANGKCDCQPN